MCASPCGQSDKGCSGRSISRILSSPGYPRTDGLAKDGHLSRLTVTRQLVQPTRDSNGTGSSSSLLGLAPDGGCPAAALLRTLVVFYTTISPMPTVTGRRFVSVARSRKLPHPGVSPASRPVECGLSSILQARPRPSDQPEQSDDTVNGRFRQFCNCPVQPQAFVV